MQFAMGILTTVMDITCISDVINFNKSVQLVSFLLLDSLIRRDKQTTNYIALKKT